MANPASASRRRPRADAPADPSPDAAAPSLSPADPAPDDDHGSDRRIGETARALRKAAGLGLKELAARTGLSAGMLSQLERGLATPSLRSLRLLSVALGVPISCFFEAPRDAPRPAFVVRAADRRLLRLSPSGVLKHLISPDGPAVIEMYELELAPGGRSGDDFQSHRGEKAGYVLEGRLRLVLDDQEHLLERGDAFRFPAVVPHLFSNPDDRPTRVIWINAALPA